MPGKLHSALKSIMRFVFALILAIGILFLIARACSSGYNKYAFYVHVGDISVFKTPLKSSDKLILSHGRKLKTEVQTMDDDIDQGDGQKSGKLRWYVCSGIDCDEGWEKAYMK